MNLAPGPKRPSHFDLVVHELASHHVVRCWPWEHVEIRTGRAGAGLVSETTDEVEIHGVLFGWQREFHAVAPISGKVLRLFEHTRGRTPLIEAIDDAIANVVSMLHTRPAYTPPPKGWRKFGRTGR